MWDCFGGTPAPYDLTISPQNIHVLPCVARNFSVWKWDSNKNRYNARYDIISISELLLAAGLDLDVPEGVRGHVTSEGHQFGRPRDQNC